jgi:hypothetical protein
VDGPFGSNLKTEHYTTIGARVVRLQNIGRGAFLDHDKAFVSLAHYANLARHSVSEGDIVVAALGDGARPAGRACLIPADLGPALVKADCFRLRLPSDVIDPKYLVHYLNSPECLASIAEMMRGATRPRVNLVMLRALHAPLPPLIEQRRIAARLDKAAPAVEQARAAAGRQLDTAREFGISALDAFFQSQEALRWPHRPLGEILTLRNEVVHPSDGLQGRVVFVGLEHIESHTGRRIGSLEVELEQLTGRKPRFEGGDIIYGYLRPYLNKVWVADCAGLCSVDQYVYKVAEALAIPDFVAAFMRTRSYLRAAPISETPGQLPRIRTDEVARVLIPLPSIQQQSAALMALQGIVSESERLLRAAEQQLLEINLLPAVLLREAFSGAL